MDILIERVKRDVSAHKINELEEDVIEGVIDPGTAADSIIKKIKN